MQQPLAIFDLDNTLLNGDSDHAWGEYLIEIGWVDEHLHRKKNNGFYEDYLAGTLDIFAYQSFVLQPLIGKPWDLLSEIRKVFVESHITPLISQKSIDLINSHKAQNHHLLIITATNHFITEPIAALLGIEHLIATEPEWKNQQLTGKITGTPSFQEGKITRLKEWLIRQQMIQCLDDPALSTLLNEGYFYSDSINDLPLLESVGNPVAVNPDARLMHQANQNDWRIISLK